jgi:uncharacterized protein YbcC (UPF0753/DUF2309 family)
MNNWQARSSFDEQRLLHDLHHYLPSQAPLKDFVHHNTLHALQHLPFDEAMREATREWGHRTYLDIDFYRTRWATGQIAPEQLDRAMVRAGFGPEQRSLLLHDELPEIPKARIGQIRSQWKSQRRLNLDKHIHTRLFTYIASYLDQGVGIWRFPAENTTGLWDALRKVEAQGKGGLFQGSRSRAYLLGHERPNLRELLEPLLADEEFWQAYLVDSAFAHPGWSGLVAQLEREPHGLMDRRPISLLDFIAMELLMEWDVLEAHNGQEWSPLKPHWPEQTGEEALREHLRVLACWQDAWEWSRYDQVLNGLEAERNRPTRRADGVGEAMDLVYQAIFCIDDRECSIRRHLEAQQPAASTYGVAGFFQIDCNFRPEEAQFDTKCCPGPMIPTHTVKESGAEKRHQRDAHMSRHSHGMLGGWISAGGLGFAAAWRLVVNILFPSDSPAMVRSERHMDPNGTLHFWDDDPELQGVHGFTLDEAIRAMEVLLKSIGMVDGFASVVYLLGHGASSVNNTHYAGYDCGACSGRSGSVNARVAASLLNDERVRLGLAVRGVRVPETTWFIGGLHDTTRDEFFFFDEAKWPASAMEVHARELPGMLKALQNNAVERARRFDGISDQLPAKAIHRGVRQRARRLFEPRPEWNHATNHLCLIGRRQATRNLFLDRSAFLNSYDPLFDPTGEMLAGILNAVVPVCGGINLEYYFSKVDNDRLGAGSKLPHNVVGLVAVANGMDGDLRTGLPLQMVNIHEPYRLMVVLDAPFGLAEQVLRANPRTLEWIENSWVHFVVRNENTGEFRRWENGSLKPYEPLKGWTEEVGDWSEAYAHRKDSIEVKRLASTCVAS